MTQPSTHRCDCGADAPVQAGADWNPTSPYEFTWSCGCGRAGVISWFHGAPPPTFDAPRGQLELF